MKAIAPFCPIFTGFFSSILVILITVSSEDGIITLIGDNSYDIEYPSKLFL